MGSFETIVRPVVFPSIRPVAPRSVAPESDPEKGLARINGQGGKIISLPYNFTHSLSRTKQKEIKRRVDVVRVYQKEEDGTVNRANFIDVEVTNKLWVGESGAAGTSGGTSAGGSADHEWPLHLRRPDLDDNLEFIKENVVKTNPRF